MARFWGMRPKSASLMYETISKLILTCAAAPAWWKKRKMKSTQAKLSKLQRLACMGNTSAIRTTQAAALEALDLDVTPLHIVIKKEAILSGARRKEVCEPIHSQGYRTSGSVSD